MTASASVVVPVGLLNEAAGLLELEGYRPLSMGPLACLTQPAEQDAREAVARVEDDLRTRNLYDEGEGSPRLKVREDDLRTLLALTQAAPDGWVLVPVDDDALAFSDSRLPDEMIEAGQAVLDRVHEDGRAYVAGETIDWDAGMIAVAIYRAMLSASPAPPAQGAGG